MVEVFKFKGRKPYGEITVHVSPHPGLQDIFPDASHSITVHGSEVGDIITQQPISGLTDEAIIASLKKEAASYGASI